MQERFVSESIAPVSGTADVRGMARGEPGLPMRFVWRKKEYSVAQVLGQWKETSGCKSGSDERYVRKHWFHVRTTDGQEMKIYFERQPRFGRERRRRWWLYSVASVEHTPEEGEP